MLPYPILPYLMLPNLSLPYLPWPYLTLPHLAVSNFHPTSSASIYYTHHLILLFLKGIGSNEKSVVSSTEYDKNRIEVLRVMIAAFSDSLYQVRTVSKMRCSYFSDQSIAYSLLIFWFSFYLLLSLCLSLLSYYLFFLPPLYILSSLT